MKKLNITFLLALLMSMVGVKALAAYYDAKIDGIYYNLSGTNATVTYLYPDTLNKNAYKGNVVIPDSITYNGSVYYVNSIGYKAFESCKYLSSVTLPNSIKRIDSHAFAWCSILTSINIPDSVSYIGASAFRFCNKLTNIIIPKSVNYIGQTAFENCPGLLTVNCNIPDASYQDSPFHNSNFDEVRFGEEVSSIGNSAFYKSTIKSVILPSSLKSIGGMAFSGCSKLTSLTLPDSLLSIGSETFSGCTGIKNVSIPNSVTSIGSRAFSGCSGLTNITIGNSVTSIGSSAFSSCSNLKSVSLECYEIKNWFSGMSSIKDIIIGENVTIIGNSAFSSCSGLESVIIPTGVKRLGNAAFYNCSNLKEITINNSVKVIGDSTFCKCSGLTSIVIPNSVTSIGEKAFLSCSSLTSVTIGNSVTSIGAQAFSSCTSLTDVTSLQKVPPTIYDNTFPNRASQTLYVPYGCKDAYMIAPYWFGFKQIVEMDEEEKCSTPTISFANGKLTYECETEGVEFVTNISLADMQNNNQIDLFSVYHFSVYAKKDGYADSDVATVNIDLNRLKGDMNNDGVISIADAVALVNIVLGGVSGSARYYSVGLDPVTADNYTTANDAHQVNSLNAIPSTLLTVTTPGVYYILLPDQFEPEVGGVVYYNVTKLNVNIPSYSVYRTASLSSGVQIKRVNVGTSGSQIDYE